VCAAIEWCLELLLCGAGSRDARAAAAAAAAARGQAAGARCAPATEGRAVGGALVGRRGGGAGREACLHPRSRLLFGLRTRGGPLAGAAAAAGVRGVARHALGVLGEEHDVGVDGHAGAHRPSTACCNAVNTVLHNGFPPQSRAWAVVALVPARSGDEVLGGHNTQVEIDLLGVLPPRVASRL